MSIFERWIHVDLEAGPYKDTVPNGFFQRDSKANRLGVIVSRGHEKATLSGTIQGIAKLPIDGENLFEFNGAVDADDTSKAYVDLPKEVYLNNGLVTIAIRLVNGSDKMVLATFSGYVSGVTGGTPSVPAGTLPDDIDKFIAYLTQLEQDVAAAQAAAEAVADVDKQIGDLKSASALQAENVPDTVQTITFDEVGNVARITHMRGDVAIRTDVFTFGEGTITEVRTLNTGESLTIVTNTTTLQTTVTYTAA